MCEPVKSNHTSSDINIAIKVSLMQLCQYYGSRIGCKYGDNCRFSHSNPNSIEFCRFFPACSKGEHCRYRHKVFSSNEQQTPIKQNNNKTNLSKHEILMHGFVRQIKPNQITPIEITYILTKYCNSLIPALLKLIKHKLYRNELIQKKIAEYYQTVLKYNMWQSNSITSKILWYYSLHKPQSYTYFNCIHYNHINDNICNIFYDEQRYFDRIHERIKFETKCTSDNTFTLKVHKKVENIMNTLNPMVNKNIICNITARLIVNNNRNNLLDAIFNVRNDDNDLCGMVVTQWNAMTFYTTANIDTLTKIVYRLTL
eukprot:435819_1